jgi:BolA protein
VSAEQVAITSDTQALLRERLAALDPAQVDLYDESREHAGHAGARDGGGHFQLTIVSARFAGLDRLARHRMVYQAVGELIPARVHALSICAYTPEEMNAAFER